MKYPCNPYENDLSWKRGIQRVKPRKSLVKKWKKLDITRGLEADEEKLDSGSSEDFLHAGSSPVSRTTIRLVRDGFLFYSCKNGLFLNEYGLFYAYICIIPSSIPS